MTEFAWLIELPNGSAGPPTYWDGRGAKTFHRDHEEAIRFARKEDAERALYWLVSKTRLNEGAFVCEHGWDDDPGRPLPKHGSGGGDMLAVRPAKEPPHD